MLTRNDNEDRRRSLPLNRYNTCNVTTHQRSANSICYISVVHIHCVNLMQLVICPYSGASAETMMINYGIGQTVPHGPGRMIAYQQMKGTDNPGLIKHPWGMGALSNANISVDAKLVLQVDGEEIVKMIWSLSNTRKLYHVLQKESSTIKYFISITFW